MDDRAREKAKQIVRDWSGNHEVRSTPVTPAEINNEIWRLIQRANEVREALKPALERIEALESLLVCYRLGKQPTEALHKKLERTRIAVESIRSLIKTAPEGESDGR